MSQPSREVSSLTSLSLLELTIFVARIDQSVRFYRALGLNLFEVHELGHPRHFEGGIGDAAVQIFPALGDPATRVQIGLRVSSTDHVAARLRSAGFDFVRLGPRRLRTVDPDGNRVHVTDVGGASPEEVK